MMIGFNNLEGMHWDVYKLFSKGRSEFVADYSTLIPNNVNCNKGSLYSGTVAAMIKEKYFGYTDDDPCVWDKMPLFDVHTDVFWLRGIYSAVRSHLSVSGSPIFFYRFCADTQLNLAKRLSARFDTNCNCVGASNGDELSYLFRSPMSPKVASGSREDLAIERMVQMWTNFASCGHATPEVTDLLNEGWEPATRRRKILFCMDIGERLGLSLEPEIERMKFWDEIYRNDFRTRAL